MAEVWFRNPHNYIRELAEVGAGNVAWDRGMLEKRRIDPYKHAEAYFQGKNDWRVLLIGTQGSAELRPGHDKSNPVGVYPTWSATDESLTLLEEMMQYPVGEDADACNDPSLAPDERPVSGQEHRVIVTDIPAISSGVGRQLVTRLKELQEDYPECILHLHGLYSWRVSFGMGFGAADVDPRTNAGKGKVTLPMGKEMFAERTVAMVQWVTLLGMKPIDLCKEPRNRCIYNIKSAQWAAEHFMENIAFKSTGSTPATVSTTTKTTAPATTASHLGNSGTAAKAQPGDKLQCDTCSLQTTCKYFRTGSVCSVPGSEPAPLAKMFKTRDAQTIIDGLGTVLALQTRRLEKGVSEENTFGELDPHVTKIADQLFKNGTKLAMLLDPALRAGPQVQVNVGGAGGAGANNAAIQAATPNMVMAKIVGELEARGIERSKITPRMVENLLAEMAGAGNAPAAIEGAVLSSRDERDDE